MITACSGSISTTQSRRRSGAGGTEVQSLSEPYHFSRSENRSMHSSRSDYCLLGYVLAGRSAGRCKNHPPCFNFITYRDDFHAVSDADTCIGPREIVDPDLILVPVLNKERQTLATVRRFPSTATMSPGDIFSTALFRGQAVPFPATLITRISTINLQKYLKASP